jgi:hypothetical protein
MYCNFYCLLLSILTYFIIIVAWFLFDMFYILWFVTYYTGLSGTRKKLQLQLQSDARNKREQNDDMGGFDDLTAAIMTLSWRVGHKIYKHDSKLCKISWMFAHNTTSLSLKWKAKQCCNDSGLFVFNKCSCTLKLNLLLLQIRSQQSGSPKRLI